MERLAGYWFERGQHYANSSELFRLRALDLSALKGCFGLPFLWEDDEGDAITPYIDAFKAFHAEHGDAGLMQRLNDLYREFNIVDQGEDSLTLPSTWSDEDTNLMIGQAILALQYLFTRQYLYLTNQIVAVNLGNLLTCRN